MSDLPHLAARQSVVHRLATLHLTDEARVRHFIEHSAPEQDHELIAPQDATFSVDDTEAIGVAIERDAQLGTEVRDGGDEIAEVLGNCWIGMVMRKAAVEFAVERHDVEPQLCVESGCRGAARSVAGIDDDL